jgi:tRNA(fMet)-specific endonuclease VapC
MVDSSVLIDLERRGLSPSALREDEDEIWTISAVTVSELLFGLERASTPVQRARREAFMEAALVAFPVLPFDLEAARVHARIWAELVGTGQRIGTHDFLIAATALANEHTLLTDNPREFARIAGLNVRQPNWP